MKKREFLHTPVPPYHKVDDLTTKALVASPDVPVDTLSPPRAFSETLNGRGGGGPSVDGRGPRSLLAPEPFPEDQEGPISTQAPKGRRTSGKGVTVSSQKASLAL